MRVKNYVMIGAAVAVAAGGAGVAIAATGGDDRKQAEQSILNDAAKRLNVSPEDLKNALGAAEDAQLDQAVKDGKITQAQADAIKKQRQQSGRVLGVGPGGPGVGGPGHFGPGGLAFRLGPGGALDAAASALGLKLDDLLSQLRDGKSIADIAKAQNKSLDDVKKAVTDGVAKELDRQVAAKHLTADQKAKILTELNEHLDDLVDGKGPAGGPDGPGGPGFGRGALGFGLRFGAGGTLDAAASALGLKPADLLSELRDGKSVADIAKAQNKSLDDVKKAVTDGVAKELDRQVAAKHLTADQKAKILTELSDHLDDLVNLKPPTPPAGAGAALEGLRRGLWS